MESSENFSFTPEQLEQIRNLLPKEKQEELSNILSESSLNKEIGPEEKVKERVFNILAELSGFDQSEIFETQDLYRDLGMVEYKKKALKSPFQKIVKENGSDEVIQVKECKALKTVQDCLDLVNSKL